ncbi:hypothetical protein [Bradyrhizobium sp. SRS-191]|uniref:hypothetical protein n=1 Tax=Bradyrhizobium sp. SRS-191 TaxID=2962606 RepID=UPI00211EF3AD|nr:hypothetical protein [Bradyrhizobium sp. SRS-191]
MRYVLGFAAATPAQIHPARKAKLLQRFNIITSVQMLAKKFSCFVFDEIMFSSLYPVLMQRDVRVVTIRRGGERWPRACQVLMRWTIGKPADGQAVWSWRPDAGAKPR